MQWTVSVDFTFQKEEEISSRDLIRMELLFESWNNILKIKFKKKTSTVFFMQRTF
jgi:hypothetical protein